MHNMMNVINITKLRGGGCFKKLMEKLHNLSTSLFHKLSEDPSHLNIIKMASFILCILLQFKKKRIGGEEKENHDDIHCGRWLL